MLVHKRRDSAADGLVARWIRPRRLVLLVAICALAVPATASAQATRTWVSGVGDDANPCSRTAPCKTFAGAISKTAARGEINVLDPGGFGGVTITKAISIRANGVGTGGVLVSGTNAIVINAGANDDVTLEGLDINGIGTSLNAIRILQADDVRIDNTDILGFTRNAVDVEPSNIGNKVIVSDVRARNNTGAGVMVAPQATGRAEVTVRNSELDDNSCGVAVSSFVIDPAFDYATRCGTLASGGTRVAIASVFDTDIGENLRRGVFANGADAEVRLGGSSVTGSNTGLSVATSGEILSYGDNYVVGNGTDGDPTGTLVEK